MTGFIGSNNKVVVRQAWDLPILRRWSANLGRRLSYFGLPGPNIEDLLDWRDYIDRSTGVERLRKGKSHKDDLDIQHQLMSNIMLNEIYGFQLLRGDIENILIQGQDVDGTKPALSTDEHPLVAHFRYDLANLDFFGGIYTDGSGESKRIISVQKLIERQKGHDFLLLLTLNVRNTADDEYSKYLEGAERQAASNHLREHEVALSWYRSTGERMERYRLKALVPLFVRLEAERSGFDCFCYPPLSYTGGGKAEMVHFIFELRYTMTMLHAHSVQSLSEVINLPLVEANQGTIWVLPEQHPDFDFGVCEEQLMKLPSEMRIPLLASLSGKVNGRYE